MMNRNRNKKVLLIGGLSKAKSLAVSLISQGYSVTAVNKDYDDCTKLAEMKDLTVIYGDGTTPYILEEARASEYDTVIALTSRDEDNLVACQLCKKKFGVRKAVSLLGDPKKTEFFYKIGIDSVVCAISVVTSVIQQQAFIDEMVNIFPVGYGKEQIVQVQIPDDSPAAGKKLWEISLPEEVIIGCVHRGDKTLIPRGDTRIYAGDTLVMISQSGQEGEALKALTGR